MNDAEPPTYVLTRSMSVATNHDRSYGHHMLGDCSRYGLRLVAASDS